MMRLVAMAALVAGLGVAAPVAGEEPEPVAGESGEWSAGGPYRLDLLLAVGIGARLDDPPRFEASSRAVPMIEAGLDLALSDRILLWLHYERIALAPEDSGLLPGGQVTIDRSVDALWAGLRVDPLRSEQVAGYLRLGIGPAWQHLDVEGLVWPPVTPSQQTRLSCGATGLGFALRAAVGVDVVMYDDLRFLGEVGLDNYRLSSGVVGGCGPGAGTATIIGLRGGFAYGFPL